MVIEHKPRPVLALILVGVASLLGAAVLDHIANDEQDAQIMVAIEQRFVEHSLKTGAWSMDRRCVAEYIGLDETTLPSYKRTDETKGVRPALTCEPPKP